MQLISTDFKHGKVVLRITTLDDLWFLSNIIEPDDIVSAKTVRKIKIGGEDERSGKVTKRPVTLTLKVEKTEYAAEKTSLRISGIIQEGPDDIPLGSYHTFNADIKTELTISKEWTMHTKELLNDATKEQTTTLLILFDREEALFAKTATKGYHVLAHIHGEVQKKDERVKPKGNFYTDIIKATEEYNERLKPEHIIFASPAFYTDELKKQHPPESIAKKSVYTTCSSVKPAAIPEVIARDDVQQTLATSRTREEMVAVNIVLKEIAQDGAVTYGLKDVQVAGQNGAIKELLITDKHVMDAKEQGTYQQVNELMKQVSSLHGKILIISSDHDGGKKLDALGGIAALLRYKY